MFWLWRLFQRLRGWRGILAEILLAWRLFRDPRVPLRPKLVILAVLLYFVSPINLSFQWIPLLGQVDDVAIALFSLGLFLKLSPQHLVAEHARRLERELAQTERLGRFGRFSRYVRPSFKRWTGAAPDQARASKPSDRATRRAGGG
jgi:uncharacterized membrane protein YkvA (DUF1232 family)